MRQYWKRSFIKEKDFFYEWGMYLWHHVSFIEICLFCLLRALCKYILISLNKNKIKTKLLPSFKITSEPGYFTCTIWVCMHLFISLLSCQTQTKLFWKPCTSHLLQWLRLGRVDKSHPWGVCLSASLLLGSSFSLQTAPGLQWAWRENAQWGCWLSAPFTLCNYIADCAFLKRS